MVWLIFLIFVLALLGIDLYLLSKHGAQVPTIKQALRQTSIWVALGLGFSGIIFYLYDAGLYRSETVLTGKDAFLQYLTGYLIEQALSVDNLFVIALIMGFFRVPSQHQHKILFWGIIGVLVTRGLMIGLGYALVQSFSWINYFFGAILLYSAYKMWATDEEATPDFDNNIAARVVRLFVPVTNSFDGDRFFTKIDGKTAATTLFLALLVVETTDIVFAFDSVPAVFSVTKDPFLVFSSNIFAILGLRSLYFVLASSIEKFEYLETALIAILAFIGLKMILEHLIHIPTVVSLGVVVTFLALGIGFSLYAQKKRARVEPK